MKPFTNKNAPMKGNRMILIATTVTGMLAGAAYWYDTPAEYTSQAIIRTTSGAVTEELKSVDFLSKSLEKTPSPQIFQQQNFRTVPANAPFTLSCRSLGGNFTAIPLQITLQGETGYLVKTSLYSIDKQITATEGEEFVIGNLAITLTAKETRETKGNETYDIQLISSQTTVQQLANTDALSIEKGDGVVTISVTDNDPKRAKEIASNITSAYTGTTDQNEASVQPYDEKIIALNEKMAETERAIAEFKKRNGITTIESDVASEKEYGNTLREQKAALEMQMVALGNLHTYIRKNMEGSYTGMEYDVITDPMFTEAINKINDRYLQRAAAGLEQASSDAELMAMKEVVSERILNTRRKIAVKIDQVNGLLGMHEARIAKFPAYASTLEQMNRRLEMDKSVYDMLITKRAEAMVSGKINTPTSVIQDATLPVTPIQPHPFNAMVLFGTAGLILGAVISKLRNDRNREIIHNRKEAEETAKGIRFIGSVGTLTGLHAASDTSFSNLSTRFLMTENSKIVTITSSLKGEGKTFIASNFAKSLASLDKKVLIVDMNMQRPEIAHTFDIQCERTLADVLARKCDIHDAIFITSIPNLEVAVAGMLPGGVNALLVSKDSKAIFDKLRAHYDAIIIDTPEVGKYIDAVPMMRMSDMNFYVVRANGTSRAQLENADLIRKDFGINNLYMVLNTTEKGVNHSGLQPKGKYRKLKKHDAPRLSSSSIPEVLRKIALWFY